MLHEQRPIIQTAGDSIIETVQRKHDPPRGAECAQPIFNHNKYIMFIDDRGGMAWMTTTPIRHTMRP